MEVLDIIEAWQTEHGDLIQFEAYDPEDNARYIELLRVDGYMHNSEEQCIIVTGYSEITGDNTTHVLDYNLELEIMGA